MSRATLVLFSGSYPFSVAAESSFIGPELPYLVEEFERVILVPASLEGDREELPAGVELEAGYARLQANRLTVPTVLAALQSTLLLEEIRRRPISLIQPAAMRFMVRHAGNAVRTRRWLQGFMERQGVDPESALFYTYWMGPTTLGLAREKAADGRISLVTRAHGYDLYPQRHRPEYIPFQAQTMEMLDGLFLACEHARQYVLRAHPAVADRAEVFRLGVTGDGVRNEPSRDGVFRIASCSYLVPWKRVDLLLRAVGMLGERMTKPVEWYHLGGGAEEPALKAAAADPGVMPKRVKYHFLGNLSGEQVRDFYRTTPVDVFAHVSATEGGVPVAITEAQSYGIPAVASAVGGIPEIVGADNGTLVPQDPTAREIAEALMRYAGGAGAARAREASHRAWASAFDAAQTFPRFASRLRAVLDARIHARQPNVVPGHEAWAAAFDTRREVAH